MALTDPQTITINAVPNTCNRVQSDGYKSVYATADGNIRLTVSHQAVKGRNRRMARIDKRVIAADPLTAENGYQMLGVYVVIDEPEVGFADADIDYVVQALVAWLSSATVTKILGAQH